MTEVGARLGRQGRDRLTGRVALFTADWKHIQADLIDREGLPCTASIGDGRLRGVDGEVTWLVTQPLRLTASAVLIDSSLYKPEPVFSTARLQTLPNIARTRGRIAASWRRDLRGYIVLNIDASASYEGRSRLGVGDVLNIPQGGYATADASARLEFGAFELSLDVDNLTNEKANTFAFGNPFSVGDRDQRTPVRPRTARLGFSAHW